MPKRDHSGFTLYCTMNLFVYLETFLFHFSFGSFICLFPNKCMIHLRHFILSGCKQRMFLFSSLAFRTRGNLSSQACVLASCDLVNFHNR